MGLYHGCRLNQDTELHMLKASSEQCRFLVSVSLANSVLFEHDLNSRRTTLRWPMLEGIAGALDFIFSGWIARQAQRHAGADQQ
jgi:hypothetical protein